MFFARKTPFDFCYCCTIHDAYHALCRDREKSQCFFLRVFNECEVINIFSCISCFCSYRLYNVGNNFTDGKCILRKFVIQKTKSTRDTAEISSSLRVIVILLQREMVQFRAYMYYAI